MLRLGDKDPQKDLCWQFSAWRVHRTARYRLAPTREAARATPVASLDYVYISEGNADGGGGEATAPLTVLKSKEVDSYQSELAREFLNRLGHGTCCLHTDGEPAAVALVRRVCELRGVQHTQPRVAPRFSPQSMGRLGACQEILEGQVRTLKLDIEVKLKEKLPVVHSPLFAWLVRHAAWQMNRFRRLPDKHSPYTRHHA
eukprot:5440779-Amphidinium_carterae.2